MSAYAQNLLVTAYPTAWLLHHKINRAMAQQDENHRLSGAVQLDDAYLGGERAGGKVGRGSENKVPFVAAVSLNDKGRPFHLKLSLISGFTSQAISKWAKAALAPGTIVTSDGLSCFAAVADAGCVHVPVVVGALKPRDLPQFKWVNTVLGNLKTTLAGAFHSLPGAVARKAQAAAQLRTEDFNAALRGATHKRQSPGIRPIRRWREIRLAWHEGEGGASSAKGCNITTQARRVAALLLENS